MGEDGGEPLEGTEAVIENAAKPREAEKTEVAPRPGPAPAEHQGQAAELVVPSRDQEAVRSVFIARMTGLSVAGAEDFAAMETTDNGLAVRRAYRAHSAVVEEQLVAGAPAIVPDLLRKIFRARAVANGAVEPHPKQRAAKIRVRKASRLQAKGTSTKPATGKKGSAGKTRGRTSSKGATRSRRPKRR